MSKIIPITAVRPQKKFAKAVAALPYDVVSVAEAREAAAHNELTYFHIEKSEIDLPDSVKGNAVHETAQANLTEFLQDGILMRDESPCYYVYRQKMGNHDQYGLVAGISVDEYETGLIKKHELTRADKEEDRTRHVDVVNAQTGPVFITYRQKESIDSIVRRIAGGEPEYDFVADDGITHTVWIVRDKQDIASITVEFSAVDALYIADGHHRAAAAAAVARIRKGANPGHTGNESYNFFLAVMFPHTQLQILDYNRVVNDLNGLKEDAFLKKVGKEFIVESDFSERKPDKSHKFGMYLAGRWYSLTSKTEHYKGRGPVKSLDVSVLQHYLLAPILGIKDPRTDARIDFVGGIRGMDELEKIVNSGKFAVAFSMFPPALEEMMAVADAGFVMPPKSTWFEPKLRSGLFTRILD